MGKERQTSERVKKLHIININIPFGTSWGGPFTYFPVRPREICRDEQQPDQKPLAEIKSFYEAVGAYLDGKLPD